MGGVLGEVALFWLFERNKNGHFGVLVHVVSVIMLRWEPWVCFLRFIFTNGESFFDK
jgi:hypothetical protein